MIPANAFTPTPEVSQFLYPHDQPYHPLSQLIIGGVALSNPAEGRDKYLWRVSYDGTNITLGRDGGLAEMTFTEANVLTVSAAFDANMNPAIAWTTTGGANLYYFNALTFLYTTRFFPDVTSCRLCVDNSRDFYTASSDIIFSYTTLANNLYYRQQRDRYDVEYLIGATNAKLLTRTAPNVENRLQFQLR